MQRPVPGEISSAFGLRRIFNGQPRSQHKGLDLRGAAGTPVLAMADGTVALAEELYFSGNVVYLDHGLGLFSMYAHLSAIDVRPGQQVSAGQALGKVGSTGRVTGPHLHLGCYALGMAVDPTPLMEAGKQP
ncbi:MAG: M23 family metallopeptidase [Deltaproteobacteria bacterium]|nr:M23 family metallopeptidase [Deltaproteobacteria bacterium]